MNPYRKLVDDWARLTAPPGRFPLGGFAASPRPEVAPDAPRVLIFSPHPDDECLVGALALRLLRQARMNVINVAVTLGSNKQRQAARLVELEGACHHLGFGLLAAAPGGLERVNATARAQDPAHWSACVDVIAAVLAEHRPRVVFCPHDADWNSTHIGTSLLVSDALARQGVDFACHVVHTEFWRALATPNLMVESSIDDTADLVAATSFHAGEVARNPYHLLLPAWLQDNVRRGGELVGGQGGAVPDFRFATLYRVGYWQGGKNEPGFEGGRFLAAADDPVALFA